MYKLCFLIDASVFPVLVFASSVVNEPLLRLRLREVTGNWLVASYRETIHRFVSLAILLVHHNIFSLNFLFSNF